MHLKYCILAILAGCSLLVQGQVIRVTEVGSGRPLDQAMVVGFPQRYGMVMTNRQGEADITGMRGAAKIEIHLSGYAIATTTYDALVAAGSISLETSPLVLEEMVVSASRWSQPSNRVPAKVVTIQPKDIALLNPQTSADLLGISGKVFIQKSQQGGGSPMIRGFATNRLLYSVDGVRMNTAIFRSGNIQNVISLDPLANQSVEVLFGPGAVSYGSDAIGGVMSFQTLAPVFALGDEPTVSGGALTRFSSANQEFTGHLNVKVGWRKWASVTSISHSDFGDLRQGSIGPDDYLRKEYVVRQDSTDVVVTNPDPRVQIPSGYDQINLMQKVAFKPHARLDFTYALHYSQTSPYARYDRHLRTRNGLPRYAEWNYGPQLWVMNQFTTNWQARHGLFDKVSLRAAVQQFEESRIDRSFNRPDRTTQTEEVMAYSANLDFLKELSANNVLTYGVEYVLNDVTSSGIVTDITTGQDRGGPSRYPNSNWQSLGVFATDQWDLSPQWTVQAGARYNLFGLNANFANNLPYYPFPFETAETRFGGVSGSLGAVYRPADDWVLQANFSRAFRAPNVDDMGKVFDSEPGAVLVPNPDLTPEEAWNADLGVAKVFGNALKVDVTAFYTLLNNALVRRPFTLNGQDSIVYDGELSQVLAIQNAARATVWGLQFGLEWKLPAGFSFSADVNYQRGEEELDDGTTSPLRHASPLFGTARLAYARNGLSMMLFAQGQAEFTFEQLPQEEQAKTEIYALDANGNPYAPGWYTLNFKAQYALTDYLNLGGGVENLTDIRYRPYSSGISGAGRNFVISLQARF
jgi:hemoglobin/transferrin/lactoferrin receptor protein